MSNEPLTDRATTRSDSSSSNGTIVIEPRQNSVGPYVRDFWRDRRLVKFFGNRLLTKLYARTKLGWVWIPLRPVLDVVTRSFVFGGLLAAPSEGVPYTLFFVVGLTLWSFFDRFLFWATRSIEMNSKLIEKMFFARLVLPVSAGLPTLIEFGVYVVLTALASLYFWATDGIYYFQFGSELLTALAGFLLVAVLAFGIGLWTSVLGAFTRDTRFTLSYATGFLFFVTPIIYPLSSVSGRVRDLMMLNPLTAPVEMVRYGLMGIGGAPPQALTATLVAATFFLVSGMWFFSRAEAAAVDTL